MPEEQILQECAEEIKKLLEALTEKYGRQVGITVALSPVQQAALAAANAALQQSGLAAQNSFGLQFVLGEVRPIPNIQDLQKSNRQTRRK